MSKPLVSLIQASLISSLFLPEQEISKGAITSKAKIFFILKPFGRSIRGLKRASAWPQQHYSLGGV
jgi:hypothetical protein